MVEIQIQPGLISSTPTCNVWSGVTSPPLGLGFTHQCNQVQLPASSGTFYYQITGFNAIPPMTKITISYTGLTASSAVASQPFVINSYFSASVRASSPSNAANQNDYYR